MKVRLILPILCLSASALTLPLTLPVPLALTSAHAYEGLEADFKICTQGGGKVANTKIVQACSGLINNAAKHNSLTGSFFALRAIANTDKVSNCNDARQAIKLLENPELIKLAKTLEKQNC